MGMNTYEIKDNCRRNLNKYTIKAFSFIPKIDNPLILDMGCGTGVPTLALIEICNGNVYAVDSDNSCLLWLKEKVNALNYSDRIKVINASVFDINLFNNKFDIILAEGLLNVIGFEKGLPTLIDYLKENGYLIIHDELHNDTEKKTIYAKYNLKLLNSFVLDENVWWNDYYSCLEKSVKNEDNDLLFNNEINEIVEFKKDSKKFRSIYYVLQK
ncbi:MAG: class I SAM-dependent methyltransferase [Bacillota bacterium]